MKLIKYAKLTAITVALIGAGTVSASEELAQSSNCLACHNIDQKLVGPSFKEIAEKYSGDAGAVDTLVDKVKNGGGGVWGQIPMPPNPAVSDEDAKALVEWLLSMQ
ncbi:MAG: c-type cytochrome [bacterium]